MNWTHRPVISATGLYTPPETITNEELVESFNSYVWRFNEEHAEAISAGTCEPLMESSVAFIEKASGIKARHVVAKQPVLDIEVMAPRLPERTDDELSILAENWRCGRPRRASECAARPGRCRCGAVCGIEYATALSGDGHRDSAGARHRGVRLRHECGVLVCHFRHSNSCRLYSLGKCAQRSGGEPGDHEWPPQLARPR